METKIILPAFWTRIWALLIDTIILGVLGYLLGLTMEDFFIRIGNNGLLFGLGISLLYQTFFNSKLFNGQTVGKKLMNIQVVDIQGNTIGLDKSFIRSLIFSLPYFTVNLSIPGITENSALNIIKSGILAFVVIGIVVIYIFNKQTRQSLHDLAVGSYVASTERKEEPAILSGLTKTPFIALGGFIILLLGFALFMNVWTVTNRKNLETVYSKLTEINGISITGVSENTMHFNSTKTHQFTVNISVISMPVNNDLANEVARIILKNADNINTYDAIAIIFTRGFDIGIASKWISSSIVKTPNQWREEVK